VSECYFPAIFFPFWHSSVHLLGLFVLPLFKVNVGVVPIEGHGVFQLGVEGIVKVFLCKVGKVRTSSEIWVEKSMNGFMVGFASWYFALNRR
jgi:hypothetical protein